MMNTELQLDVAKYGLRQIEEFCEEVIKYRKELDLEKNSSVESVLELTRAVLVELRKYETKEAI